MGYRELSRMQIVEVVRRWQAGESQRGIARVTGLARETVNKYLAAAAALWTIGIQARSMNRPCQVSVRLAVSLCWPGSHRPILHRKPATMPLVPFDPRLVPLFMASLMSVGLGVIALRRRTPGARAFAVLLIASAAWSATYALIAAPGPADKLFWDHLLYLGSTAVAPAWLVFALSYTDWRSRMARRTVLLLLATEFAVMQALIWTNGSLTGLIWTHVEFDAADLSQPLSFEYGATYWVLLLYDYALLLTGVWLIARTLVHSGRVYSRQALALLVGIAAPGAANVAYSASWIGSVDPDAIRVCHHRAGVLLGAPALSVPRRDARRPQLDLSGPARCRAGAGPSRSYRRR